jgi:hypothetical protein
VDRVVEAGWLVTLVKDVSKVPEDLGMSPIPGIPRDSCMTRGVPPEDINLLIMVQSLSLCLTGYGW